MRYAWVRKVHAAGGTEQNEDGNVRAAGDVEQDEDAAQIIDRDNEHSQIDILKEEHSKWRPSCSCRLPSNQQHYQKDFASFTTHGKHSDAN